MIVGAVVGVAQTSVKRMLAYSSIAHGGYLLVALLAANDIGKGAVLFYLLVYAITNVGAFGVIALLENADRPNDQIRDYAGLWSEHPALAALMTIFLLSLGGFPPMAGFIAKWYVFSAAIKAGYTMLAIIGVLTSERRHQSWLHDLGDRRRPDERHLGVLLSAHRGHDVHDA